MDRDEITGVSLIILLVLLVTVTIALTTSNVLLYVLSIVTTIATIVIPLLTLFNVPGRELVQKFTYRLRNSTFHGLCITALVLLLGLNFELISCAYYRTKYISYINSFNLRAPDLSLLSNAYTFFPTRTESIALLKIVHSQYRTPIAWDYIKQFIDSTTNPIAPHGALKPSRTQKCVACQQDMNESVLVTYASLLPEAGDFEGAIELLARLNNLPTANLLRQALLIDHLENVLQKYSRSGDQEQDEITNMLHGSQSDWEAYHGAIVAMEQQVNQQSFSSDIAATRSSHYYQEALDRLGSYFLFRCAIGSVAQLNRNPNNHVVDWFRTRSIETYKKVIQIRYNTIKTGNYWIRSPVKLAAYHAFLYASKADKPFFRLIPYFEKCEGFDKAFAELISTHNLTKTWWRENTIYELDDIGNLESFIRDQLKHHWRYDDVYNTYFNTDNAS